MDIARAFWSGRGTNGRGWKHILRMPNIIRVVFGVRFGWSDPVSLRRRTSPRSAARIDPSLLGRTGARRRSPGFHARAPGSKPCGSRISSDSRGCTVRLIQLQGSRTGMRFLNPFIRLSPAGPKPEPGLSGAIIEFVARPQRVSAIPWPVVDKARQNLRAQRWDQLGVREE